MRLESRAESNQRVPAGEDGILGRDTVRHFIQSYQKVDAYVISQIPQPMEKDIGIPPCLRYCWYLNLFDCVVFLYSFNLFLYHYRNSLLKTLTLMVYLISFMERIIVFKIIWNLNSN